MQQAVDLILRRHISRHCWRRAWRELLRLLESRELSAGDFDLWGRYAGQIETGMGKRWNLREAFWRDLYRSVREAENATATETHKGLIFFKIGGMGLLNGKSFSTARKWLRLAYLEDQRLRQLRLHQLRLDEPAPAIPEQQSAYRMLVILQAFERFCRKIRDQKTRRDIASLVKANRARIGYLIVRVFDVGVANPPDLRSLPWAPFDRLIGRNPYRPLVEQNYRGAEWLCRHREQINRTDLDKYGIAQAAVVLCGTTIEGILNAMPFVRKRVRQRRGRNFTLGSLTLAYIESLRGNPELTAGLIFLWFARDMIHPAVGRRALDVVIDMNFADFVWTLTGEIIARIARRVGRPRYP